MNNISSLKAGLYIRRLPALLVMVAMLGTAIAAYALTLPRQGDVALPDLEVLVPKHFGEWSETPSLQLQASLATQNREATNRDQPYDAVLLRNYVSRDGALIMLAVAYSGEQRQDVKIHRPEVCYPAQGFQLLQQRDFVLPVAGLSAPISGVQLLARNRQRLEAVSYWIRIGNAYPHNGWAMRAEILRAGISGQLSDGILVRVSSLIDDESQAPAAYAQQQRFLADLVPAVTPRAPGLLVAVPAG